jgi:hypothetical protein
VDDCKEITQGAPGYRPENPGAEVG